LPNLSGAAPDFHNFQGSGRGTMGFMSGSGATSLTILGFLRSEPDVDGNQWQPHIWDHGMVVFNIRGLDDFFYLMPT
jgi:hypothetical protein